MNPIPNGERLLCIGGPLDGQRMAFEGRDEMWAPAPPNLSSAPIVASAELPSPREDFGRVRYELVIYCDLRGERTNLWVSDSDKDSVFRRLVESYERTSDVYGKELESRVEQMTRKIDELLNSRNLLKEENRKLVFAHVAAESEVTRLLSEVARLTALASTLSTLTELAHDPSYSDEHMGNLLRAYVGRSSTDAKRGE